MAAKLNKGKIINAAQKYVQKGQYDRAIREYSKIVEEDPRDVRIWLKIGDLSARKGAKSDAVQTYLKVAEYYSEQGFYLKAVAVYKQILKIDCSQVDVNLKLAELYKQLGLLNDAMQQYELISNHYHQAGQTKEALAALRQIVDLSPENVASRIKLAELCSKEQMREEAVEEFAKAADFLRANNRIDDFIKVAERLIYHDPDNLGVTKELARLYLRRGDPRRALQKLQLAFKVDPRDEDTLDSLAQSFQDLGQVAKTISVLKELAHVQRETGRSEKRVETLKRIVGLAPDDEEALRALETASGLMMPRRGEPAQQPQPQMTGAHAVDPAARVVEQPPSGQELPFGQQGMLSAAQADYAVAVDTAAPGYGEPSPEPPAGTEDEVVRILTEADVYIKYGLHDKAVEHLRQVFNKDPGNTAVRLRLRDLYLQLGRYADASLELSTIAKHMMPTDSAETSRYLDEALQLDPNNAEAQQLAHQLRSPAGSPGDQLAYDEETFDTDTYDDASDFEEVAPISLNADDIVEEIPIEASDLLEIEDFAQSGQDDLAIDYSATGSGSIEVQGETTNTLGAGTPSSEIIPLPAQAPSLGVDAQAQQEEDVGDIEDDLEEADFFVQQGLYTEARSILDELRARSPGNPLVEAKLTDLAALRGIDFTEERDETPDIAADLAAALDQDLPVEPEIPTLDYSVEDVFEEFKKGVDNQVSDEDSDTHYDLGIAYREMGLLDDAMAEFKTAMRSREKEVLCHMMIGLCYGEKGLVAEAISQFKTGLYVDGITEREAVALYFELGQAYESLEDSPEALYYYEKVAKRDAQFRDVLIRVERLRRETGSDRQGVPSAVGQEGADADSHTLSSADGEAGVRS